jgi:hypothetical protein
MLTPTQHPSGCCFAFSTNAVFTSFLDFVGTDTAAVFDIVLDFTHTKIEQITAANLLALRLIVICCCSTIAGFVFVLDVIAALRTHQQWK